MRTIKQSATRWPLLAIAFAFCVFFGCKKDRFEPSGDFKAKWQVSDATLAEAKNKLKTSSEINFFDFSNSSRTNRFVQPVVQDRDKNAILNAVCFDLIKKNQQTGVAQDLIAAFGYPIWDRAFFPTFKPDSSNPALLLPFAKMNADSISCFILSTWNGVSFSYQVFERQSLIANLYTHQNNPKFKFILGNTVYFDKSIFGKTDTLFCQIYTTLPSFAESVKDRTICYVQSSYYIDCPLVGPEVVLDREEHCGWNSSVSEVDCPSVPIGAGNSSVSIGNSGGNTGGNPGGFGSGGGNGPIQTWPNGTNFPNNTTSTNPNAPPPTLSPDFLTFWELCFVKETDPTDISVCGRLRRLHDDKGLFSWETIQLMWSNMDFLNAAESFITNYPNVAIGGYLVDKIAKAIYTNKITASTGIQLLQLIGPLNLSPSEVSFLIDNHSMIDVFADAIQSHPNDLALINNIFSAISENQWTQVGPNLISEIIETPALLSLYEEVMQDLTFVDEAIFESPYEEVPITVTNPMCAAAVDFIREPGTNFYSAGISNLAMTLNINGTMRTFALPYVEFTAEFDAGACPGVSL